MKITIAYTDGVIEQLDTTDVVTPDALRPVFRGGGTTNFATLFRVRLDLLQTEGLRVDVFWYNPRADDQTNYTQVDSPQMSVADLGLEAGRIWKILPREQLSSIQSIDIDEKWRVERICGNLVNLAQFTMQQSVYLSADEGRTMVEQILALHDRIKEVTGLDDEEAAQQYGFTMEAFRSVERTAATLVDKNSELDAISPIDIHSYAAIIAEYMSECPQITPVDVSQKSKLPLDRVKDEWDEAADIAGIDKHAYHGCMEDDEDEPDISDDLDSILGLNEE